MKTLIKTTALLIFSIALVNCGGSDGGSGAPAPTDNGLTAGVSKIDYTNGAVNVSYTSGSRTDFYTTQSNGNKTCLANSADDQSVSDTYAQLMAYISSATIGKGSLTTVGANPRYLTVRYADGSQKTFNLNAASATTEQDILSNGDEISAYLDSLHNEINQSGNGNCFTGK